MFKRWLRRSWITITVILIILLALSTIFWFNRSTKLLPGGYTKANATAYFHGLSFEKNLPQTETINIDNKKWYVMEKNSSALLLMEPGTGKIDVKEIGNGDTLWSSNPSAEDLAKETVKGTWRRNLESPFIINYIQENTIAENMANTIGTPAKVEWRKIKNGVGIQYTLNELGFSIYLEYTLDSKGFSAHLPPLGVMETGANKMTSIELLPFFGAARDGMDGYLLVPDGPGGLISFNKKRIAGLVPYEFPVYGDDYAVQTQEFNTGGNRSDIAYPVFGMKRGDTGFIAIIEEGQFKANIVATPVGITTGFNHVDAKFQLRRLYFRPKTLTSSVKSFESDIVMDAATIRYLFLPHGQSDYVSMGKAYRDYLIEEQGVKKLQNQAGAPPLLLNVVMGASESTPTGSKIIVATTMQQTGDIATDLYKQGINNMRVGLSGWQSGGYPGKIPNRFPIDPGTGGNNGFIKLQQDLHKIGIPLALDDDLLDAAEVSGNKFSAVLDSARMISGVPMKYPQDGDWYGKTLYFDAISPQSMYDKFLPDALKGYKDLQVSSLVIDWLGGGVYSDFHSSHPLDRKATANLYVKTLDKARNAIGTIATSGAASYVLGHASHVYGFPSSTNYDFIVDKQVPFYPIAVHGLITYSTTPGNDRIEPQVELLRDIEYGSLPSYVLTNENPGILQNTNYGFLFNSQYSGLKKQIVKEYKDFAKVDTGVWSSYISDHRQVADKLFETTYENGRKVWVNYNESAVSAEGQNVNGMSFKVIAEGANP